MIRYAAVTALCLVSTACGGRGLGYGSPDAGSDAAVGADAGVDARPDASVDGGCGRQDAVQVVVDCPALLPLGWAWRGGGCDPIYCECSGSDCGALFDTESACLSAYAAECLAPDACLGLGYSECEADPRCGLVFYGGGCFDMAVCDPPDGEGTLCVEQAYACVPTADPCAQHGRESCAGGCHWVSHERELCFGQCCQPEGFGYCASNDGPADCAAQRITGCADACVDVVGYYWDGGDCQPIRCCCEGPDCAETFATLEACYAARGTSCLGCLDPTDGAVDYVQFGRCDDIDWDCFFPEWSNFENACGCGCVASGQP